MKKIIIVCMLMAGASTFGCHDITSSATNDPSTAKAKASLIIDASGNTTSKVASKSIMKDASNPSILPPVIGIACKTITAAAFAYEPNSTIHSSNYATIGGSNSPAGKWSAYYFMPVAKNRIIKNGDISDVAAWNEDPDDLLPSGFESNYYATSVSFSMDVILLEINTGCLLVKEGNVSPDTGENYTLYGELFPGDTDVEGNDILWRYPEYINSTIVYRTLSIMDTTFSSYKSQAERMAVLFVNKDVFTDMESVMIGYVDTAIVGEDKLRWVVGKQSPISSSLIVDLISNINVSNLACHSTTCIVIPYSAKAIALANATPNGADILESPVVSITFDLNNVLDAINVWDGTIGNLYANTAGGEKTGMIGIKSDITNNINPFGMSISVSE